MPSIGAKPFSVSVARFCPRCCTSSALGCLRAPRRATRDVTPGRARLGTGRSEPNATSLRKPIAAAVTPLGAGSRPNENRIRYAAKSTVWHYSASLDASSRRMPKRNPRSRSAITSDAAPERAGRAKTTFLLHMALRKHASGRSGAARARLGRTTQAGDDGTGGTTRRGQARDAAERGDATGAADQAAKPGAGAARRPGRRPGHDRDATGTHTKHEPHPRRSRPKRNGAPRRALRANASYAPER